MSLRLFLTLCISGLCGLGHVHAQQVYRCEQDGKVSYSHEPCLGAQAIDTTPTQGLDKWTGKTKRHADVQNDIFQRQLANAVRPITGKSPEEMKIAGRRQKLPMADQLQCQWLDQRIPALEKDVQHATTRNQAQADQTLYQARQKFRDLRC